jgi:hypothetical protein
MRRLYRTILLATVLAGAFTSAHAGFLQFSYSYTGQGVASAGILTTNDVLTNGAYTIVEVQGTRNASNIDGLLGPGEFGANDNLLFPAGTFLDVPGFSFSSGGAFFNVANGALGCGSASQYVETATGLCPGTGVSLSINAFNPTAGSAYFAYSYVGDGVSSAGILTANGTPGSDGGYQITGIQGLRNGVDISGLLPAGTLGANDNLIFENAPFVDVPGFSYTAGGSGYNVANSALGCGSANQYTEAATGLCPGTAISFNVTKVPEPATPALLGVGLLALGLGMRRKAARA